MNTYIKDPGGWKTNSNPSGGYMKDPGTNM